MRRNHLFSLTFICLFVLSLVSLPLGVQASESSLSSVASPNSVGRGATSEENIDSFDVHPVNRWQSIDSGMTTSIENGQLKITDIGDGSADFNQLDRDLRDLDGKVEIKFKVVTDNDSLDSQDRLEFRISNIAINDHFLFRIETPNADSFANTKILFDDLDNVQRTYSLTGDERVYEGLWYTLLCDYDVLKSTIRWRLFFENGTKVFDVNQQDIESAQGNFRSTFWEAPDIHVRIFVSSHSNDNIVSWYFDYVNAPFKEREWTQFNIPGDADWLQDDWGHHEVQDDIEDQSEWSLTVPRLDSISGSMTTEVDIVGNLDTNEFARSTFFVWAVDADDGDLHEAIEIEMSREDNAGTGYLELTVEMDNVAIFQKIVASATTDPRVYFVITTTQDRSRITLEGRYFLDRDDTSDVNYYDFVGSVVISDVATDPSQEFVIETDTSCLFTGNLNYKWIMESLSVLARDRWGDLKPELGNPIATANRIPIISDIFDWIGSIISDLGDFLSESFEATFGAIISDLQSALSGFFDDLGLLVSGVVDLLADVVGDIMDAFITWGLSVIGDIIDFFTAVIFFAWDAIGLPNVIEAFDLLLVGFGQAIAGFGQFVTDINALIANVFTLAVTGGMIIFLFLPITWSPTIGDWIKNVFGTMMFDMTFGVTILGVGGRVPAGAVWIVIVIGTGILSGSILGGFF